MTDFALVVGESKVRLWSLDARERIRRQLKQAGDVELLDRPEDLQGLSSRANVLILRADYLFEVRTLAAMMERPDSALIHPKMQSPAGAYVRASLAPITAEALATGAAKEKGLLGKEGSVQTEAHKHREGTFAEKGSGKGSSVLPEEVALISADALGAFDHQLRKAKAPLLEPVSEGAKRALEGQLYGSSYKGITDLVTKFVWPRPARLGVRFCARMRVTPNAVTTIGFLLMVWACYLFAQGQFALGLAAGWLMTYLDTVDGKLARVTVQSSRFGHLFDHGMDLIHPPFWYVYWGTALTAYQPIWGLGLSDLYWLIIVGYILGRAVEALFHLLGDASIFSWRPFDAYFRLVTARRNPCMIFLTLSLFVGRPDWGLLCVALWTSATTAVLFLRLIQGLIERVRHGRLKPWLADPESAAASHSSAYRMFSGTQSAYAAD
jgi:phosphatidylglycerophosphate synthase